MDYMQDLGLYDTIDMSKLQGELGINHYIDYLVKVCYDSKERWWSDEGLSTSQNAMGPIKDVLNALYQPVNDRNIILRRQDVIRRYIQEENDTLWEVTEQMLINHSTIRNLNKSNIHLNQASKPFYNLVHQMTRFVEGVESDKILQPFAKTMNGYLESEIARLYKFFSNSCLVADFHENEEKQEFSLVQISPYGAGVFDLGLFEKNKGQVNAYPGDEEDLSAILEFSSRCAPVIYSLGAFYFQAKAFCRLKNLRLPVCLAQINDEGYFSVTEAYPITTNVEHARRFDFSYSKDKNKFRIGGAHSGGKTEFLKNMGGYHCVGLGGGILPCNSGHIPLTEKIITILKSTKMSGKGSLESDTWKIIDTERNLGEKDLVLIDEFLDTTKPELARYLAAPLLEGMEGVCKGLGNVEARVFIVDHRTSRVENQGFSILCPELKKMEVSKIIEQRMESCKETFPGEIRVLEDLGVKELWVPTYRFLEQKPNPVEVQEHALELWNINKKRIEHEKNIHNAWHDEKIEDYGINQNKIAHEFLEKCKKTWNESEDWKVLDKMKDGEFQEVDEKENTSEDEGPDIFDYDDQIPF